MRSQIRLVWPQPTPTPTQPEPEPAFEQKEPSLFDIINWQVDNRLRELGMLPEIDDDDD